MNFTLEEYRKARQVAEQFTSLIPPMSIPFTRSKGKPSDLLVSFPMFDDRHMSVYGARRDLLCDELEYIIFARTCGRFYVRDL